MGNAEDTRRDRGRVPIGATIAELLVGADSGNAGAAKALFAELYGELRRMARRELARRGGRLSLGASTLLHEAYLNMSARAGPVFPDRQRFMAYAACVMRTLIIDYARRRRAQKRGGQFELTALDTDVAHAAPDALDLVAVGEALDDLARIDARLARVVDLKFFCGFTLAETAGLLDVTERTVQRDWDKARIYLRRSLRRDLGSG